MQMTTVKVRATGQVTDMVPDVARALINSGMAVEVKPDQRLESAATDGGAERAVTAAHAGPLRKPAKPAVRR